MGDNSKVLDALRRQCSRREYCSADVRRKALKVLDGNETEVEKIIRTLVEEKYVDDRRYASAFARDKAALAGWGEVKIRYMLSAKGISRDIIDDALVEIDGNKAVQRLERLMENKLRSLKDDPQRKLKLLRFALGRGYSYDEVSAIIEKFCKNGDI